MMLETLVGLLGTALLGVLGWAFQLQNRVTIIETQQDNLVTLINTRFDAVENRLERIEEKIWSGKY